MFRWKMNFKKKGLRILHKKVPLRRIRCNQRFPQQEDEQLVALARSVARYGLLEPLTVRQVADGYVLLAGVRRYQAARMAGVKRAAVTVVRGSEKECSLVRLALENRVQEHYLEQGRFFRELKRQGLKSARMAEASGLGEGEILAKIALSQLDESIKRTIREKGLPFPRACLLLGIAPEEQEKVLKQLCPEKRRTSFSPGKGALLVRPLFQTLDEMKQAGVHCDLSTRESGEFVDLHLRVYKESRVPMRTAL